MSVFWVDRSIVKLNNLTSWEFGSEGLIPLAGTYVFIDPVAAAGQRVAICAY